MHTLPRQSRRANRPHRRVSPWFADASPGPHQKAWKILFPPFLPLANPFLCGGWDWYRGPGTSNGLGIKSCRVLIKSPPPAPRTEWKGQLPVFARTRRRTFSVPQTPPPRVRQGPFCDARIQVHIISDLLYERINEIILHQL